MAAGAEHSRQRDFRKFRDFHSQYKKCIVSFLDAKARDDRICESVNSLEDFCSKVMQVADDAMKRDEVIHVIMDTEGDYVPPTSSRKPQPYFWHMAHLRQQGIPEAQIKEREKQQKVLVAEFSALKNPKPVVTVALSMKGKVRSGVYYSEMLLRFSLRWSRMRRKISRLR